MSQDFQHHLELNRDDILLVGYLDGELSETERRLLEERLASEPELRETLRQLDESWQYLNLLEHDETDQKLLETTLETVAVTAEQAVTELENRFSSRFSWKTAWKTGAGLTLGLFLFLGMFFWGTKSAPDKTYWVRTAMPLIDRLDMYLLIVDENPDFLRELALRRIFLSPLPAGETVQPSDYWPRPDALLASPEMSLSSKEWQSHIQRIEKLDANYYSQFYKNHERLRKMSPARQQKLRDLHHAIEQAPRHEELLQTLQNFYAWQKALPQYEKSDLRHTLAQNVTQRVDRIASMKAKQDAADLDAFQPGLMISMLAASEAGSARNLAEKLKSMDGVDQDHVLRSPPRQTLERLIREMEWNSEPE